MQKYRGLQENIMNNYRAISGSVQFSAVQLLKWITKKWTGS